MKTMHYFIYKITNTINGKCYIGQTINPSRRWSGHKSQSSTCHKLKHAMNKHGVDNFTFEIIFICFTHEDAVLFEIDFIKQYNTVENGYNITNGGEGTLGIKRGDVAVRNKQRAKLIEEDIATVQELFKHHSQQVIADMFGVSQTTISRYVKQDNKRIGNSKLTEQDVTEIFTLLDEGMQQKEIARLYNVKDGVINRIAVKWRQQKSNNHN